MRLATALAALLLVAVSPVQAQTPGDCQLGSAQADLNIADVQARLFNTGSLFFGNTTTAGNGYIVPKFSGHSPIFAAGIWVGGMMNGELRVAGSSYQNFEFWPGPLNEDGTLPDPDDCTPYDRIWVVGVYDLELYEEEGTATPDLAEWPVALGAPVIDGDGVEGNYNLEGGDRPEVYGHQTAFWVMNDVGNDHRKTLTQPIGLEVRVTAFISAETVLAQQTFYRYELVNRNSLPLEDARFSLFVDADLGDAGDDFVGTDTTRGMAFVYNRGELDANYGVPPAAGFDLLATGLGSSMLFYGENSGAGDPDDGVGMYNFMQGLWGDGTPMRAYGDGYMQAQGDTTIWAFPGDPVAQQFWSEENIDGEGTRAGLGDRRLLPSSPSFTLAPGESRTFDLAILFGQGADRLASITELRAASDAVQARYDEGTLFAPSALVLPEPGTLATPELLTPEDGATFVDESVTMSWTAVTGAEGYRVELATEPDFSDRIEYYTDETELPFSGGVNTVLTYHWRVQAGAGVERSLPSESRTFTYYRYEADDFGGGTGVVEAAYPGVEVCPDPGDPGCAEYDANTVWLDPNSTGDYVLTNPDNDLGDLLSNVNVVDGEDFEIRFTEACAEPGACLGVYASALPGGGDLIASVPFELWNTGAEADPDDAVRMIPILRAYDGTAPAADWANTFPAEQPVIAGEDTLTLSVTHRVLGMMPDRPDGYALFAAAAEGFGGPGATYDPENDGDTQVDINPANGKDCRRQSYYVDFCYRGDSNLVVAPIGGLAGLVLADLAGDGTTPPVGTVIRFDANERLLEVGAEGEVPEASPQAFALEAAYPNPFRSAAIVGYRLEQPADVRLAVYDVLGRRVAVLAEGPVAAGAHRATFDGSRLASGVYLVVLEAEGQRQTQKVMLVR